MLPSVYQFILVPQQTLSFELGDEVLRLILRLCQSSIIFSTFDVVFVSWLDATSSAEDEQVITVCYPHNTFLIST